MNMILKSSRNCLLIFLFFYLFHPSFGYNIYYGMTHAHTATGGDDGVGSYADAFNFARYTAGLDFFAITPHNHMINDLTYLDLLSAASTFTETGSFIAIAGQESFSYVSGHVNVFGANSRVDVPHGHWDVFYNQWLPAHPEVSFIQFNHPSDRRMFNHFAYDTIAANFYRAMEIISGPAFSTSTTESDSGRVYESEFRTFLNLGWKIAPVAVQDNHRWTWGKATPERTGVLANSLSKEEILEAFRQRRVFATQDKTLGVTMIADGIHYQGAEYARVTGVVSFSITAWDPEGVNNENERIRFIELWGDLNGVGGSVASLLSRSTISDNPSAASTQITINRPTVPGETYYYIKVIQRDGNQGWTAPIWIRQLGVADNAAPTFGGITAVVNYGGGNELNLYWAPAFDSTTPIKYNIYRSRIAGIFDFDRPIYASIQGTSLTDNGVSNGIRYYYIVRAIDWAFNEDTNTIQLSGIPTGTPPVGEGGRHIVINEFNVKNAPEMVELYNSTNSTINLSGWKLSSQIGQSGINTTVNLNFSMAPGSYSIVTIGPSGSLRLSNDGDILTLLDSADIIVEQVASGNRGKAPIEHLGTMSISRIPNGADSNNDGLDFNLTVRSFAFANTGSPSNIGDSPIVLNEIALTPVNRIELFNRGEVAIDLQGWFLSDGDGLFAITSTVIIQPSGYAVFDYNFAGTGGLSAWDNFYLFGSDTVRFDQAGFFNGPISDSNISTYQRFPDGDGINDSFDWNTANLNGWVVGSGTLGGLNVPVELSEFEIIANWLGPKGHRERR